MDRTSCSRRQLLGNATLAAVSTAGLMGLAGTVAPATPDANHARPRLPMRLLIKRPMENNDDQKIRAVSPQITIVGPDKFDEELPTADVVYGKLLPDQVARAKKLRWLQTTSVGVDAILCPELIQQDVILTNTRGCCGATIAEHAMSFLMALTRGVGMAAQHRAWVDLGVKQVELRGLTMGIIGLGGIGREVARRAQAMDMYVIAVDAEPMYEERYRMADELYLVDDGLDLMLKRADVLVSCAPLTPRTQGLIGAKQFSLMKDGSYLVNISRGPIVKTDDLVAALKSGKLAGAGLDVTDPEPLPNDHPLWQQKNVIITPHKAGASQLVVARESAIFTENVRRYVQGLPMLNVVDKEKGY
jgi:phosphoglycerate dehydrogenase-like enzyme